MISSCILRILYDGLQPLQLWPVNWIHAFSRFGCGSCEELKAQKVGVFSYYDEL